MDVAPTPAFANWNVSSVNFLTIYDDVVDKPCIAVVSAEYSIISPLLNPWFLKLIVFNDVDIPVVLTLNLRWVYPDPCSITLTATNVFLLSVWNLWIPLAVVSDDSPTVLIPVAPNNASAAVLNNLTVDVFTDLM